MPKGTVQSAKLEQKLVEDGDQGQQTQVPEIAGLQVMNRESDAEQQDLVSAGSKRKSTDEGEDLKESSKKNASKGSKTKKASQQHQKGQAMDECPLHLLEYMMPDDESYVKPSSSLKSSKRASRSSRATPLSPSMANIKANACAVVIPSASKMTSDLITDTGKKVRKLFTAHDEKSAEELNEAAGSTLAEPTPGRSVRRSTRTSGRPGAFATSMLM